VLLVTIKDFLDATTAGTITEWILDGEAVIEGPSCILAVLDTLVKRARKAWLLRTFGTTHAN
jgi:hypothetical protein